LHVKRARLLVQVKTGSPALVEHLSAGKAVTLRQRHTNVLP